MPCTTPSTHRGPKKWCFRLSGSDTPPVTPCKTFTKSEFWGWIILRPKIKQRWHSYTPSWLTWPIGFPLFGQFCEFPNCLSCFTVSPFISKYPSAFSSPRVTSPSQMEFPSLVRFKGKHLVDWRPRWGRFTPVLSSWRQGFGRSKIWVLQKQISTKLNPTLAWS